jgi:hypothetical protein
MSTAHANTAMPKEASRSKRTSYLSTSRVSSAKRSALKIRRTNPSELLPLGRRPGGVRKPGKQFHIYDAYTLLRNPLGDRYEAGDDILVDPHKSPEPGSTVVATLDTAPGQYFLRRYAQLEYGRKDRFELRPGIAKFPTLSAGACIVGVAVYHHHYLA